MMRAAMIGGGFIGRQHAEAYARLDDVRLVAIADTNETAGREMAEQYHCAYYADAAQMCEMADFDFVDLCLPTFLHARFTKIAAKHGKHVLCEKPFALSEAECREMIDACEAANVKIMVAQCERWMGYVQDTYRRVRNGEIGSVHLASLTRLAQHPDWTTWHRNPAQSGGGLFDLQVHDIDLLVHLFGEVDTVYAVGWKNETGCWNHVCAALRFKSGVCASSEGSEEMIDGYPFTSRFRVTGDRGGAEYTYRGGFNIEQSDDAQSEYVVYRAGGQPEFPVMPETNEYADEIKAFSDAAAAGGEVPISPEESLYVIRVTEAIRDSLETGSPVRVAPR